MNFISHSDFYLLVICTESCVLLYSCHWNRGLKKKKLSLMMENSVLAANSSFERLGISRWPVRDGLDSFTLTRLAREGLFDSKLIFSNLFSWYWLYKYYIVVTHPLGHQQTSVYNFHPTANSGKVFLGRLSNQFLMLPRGKRVCVWGWLPF